MSSELQNQPTTSKTLPVRLALLGLSLIWILLVFWLWISRGWRLPETIHDLMALFPGGDYTNGWHFPLHQLRSIGGFFLLLFTSLAWGKIVCRYALRFEPNSLVSRFLLFFLIGNIAHSILIFLIGFLQLFPFGLLLPILANLVWLKEKPDFQAIGNTFKSLRKSEWIPAGILLLILLISFIAALSPPVESDGMRYHLFGPQEYLKAGGIVAIPYNAFTNLPFQTHMVYTSALWIGGHSCPQLIHWSFYPAVIAAVYLLIRKFADALETELIRPIHLLLTLTACSVPVLAVVSAWPFVDTSTVAFTLGSLVYLLDLESRQARRAALMVGILSGGAIGTKLTAVVPGFFNGLIVTAFCLKDKHWKPWVGFTLAIILTPSPWLIKNTIIHGNPTYPAGYGMFGGEEWDPDTDAFYKNKAKEKGEEVTPLNILLSPLDATIRWQAVPVQSETSTATGFLYRLVKKQSPGYEEQNPGPAFLALLPLAIVGFILLIRNSRWDFAVIILLHLAGSWLFWLMTYQSVRFIMPQLILGIILGGVIFIKMTPSPFRFILYAAFGLLVAGQISWTEIYRLWFGRGNPVATGLGFRDKEEVLYEQFPPYAAFEWLESEVQNGEQVFFIGIYRGLYADFPVVSSDWYDRPLILELIRGTESNQEIIDNWNLNNIRFILFDRGELMAYLPYFKSRFSEEEWQRFTDLDAILLEKKNIVFQPSDGIMVIDVQRIQ